MGLSKQMNAVADLVEATGSAQCRIVQAGEVLLNMQLDPDPLDVYAVQKGILTLLIGIAEEQYLLETLDHMNHHLAPEWTQLSPWDEAKLSIETILSMTTGMDDELAPLGEINSSWRYNNTAYQYLKEILTQQSDLPLQALSDAWLFEILDMQQTRWVDRDQRLPNGKPFTGLLSTAADLTKIGLLVLAQGKHQGQQIVPAHFVKRMSEPGSKENPAWGWGWWNNRSEHYVRPMGDGSKIEGHLVPEAPADLIASRGAFGNYLYVVPSAELVIARTSHRHSDQYSDQPAHQRRQAFEHKLWSLIGQDLGS